MEKKKKEQAKIRKDFDYQNLNHEVLVMPLGDIEET
jgi:hypothetical protein